MYASHGSKRLRLLPGQCASATHQYLSRRVPTLKADELRSILSRLDVVSDRLNLCLCDKYMYGLLWDPDYETCMHVIQKMYALDGAGAANDKKMHEFIALASSKGREQVDARIQNIPRRRLTLAEIIRSDDISLLNIKAFQPDSAYGIHHDRFTLAGLLSFSTPEMYDALDGDPRFSDVTKYVQYIAMGTVRNHSVNNEKCDRMFRHVIKKIGGLQSFLDTIDSFLNVHTSNKATISRLIELHVEASVNDVGISTKSRNLLFLHAANLVFLYDRNHEIMSMIRYMLAHGWHLQPRLL
jgi:hypothetical protein